MTNTPEAQAIVESAKALREAARSHKRASTYHRYQARLAMQRLSQLETRLRALGIAITYEGEGGESHGRRTESAVNPRSLD